jgi:hypothetical protein
MFEDRGTVWATLKQPVGKQPDFDIDRIRFKITNLRAGSYEILAEYSVLTTCICSRGTVVGGIGELRKHCILNCRGNSRFYLWEDSNTIARRGGGNGLLLCLETSVNATLV